MTGGDAAALPAAATPLRGIAAAGPGLEPEAAQLHARNHLVLPGFVDTHRHVWQTAMRGICAGRHAR